MASYFLHTLSDIVALEEGRNNTNTSQRCDDTRTHYDFYQFTLIPAVLITLSFAFTKQRRNMWPGLWSGRPGLIFPMNALTRSYRISYACAFGATTSLMYRIILGAIVGESPYALRFHSSNQAAKSFATILSMLIYGLVFFPLFTSLAVGSVFSYALGSLYAWMLLAMEIYRLFQCPADAEARFLLIFRGLPALVCLSYLSVVMPIRVRRAYGERQYFDWKEAESPVTDTLSDIRVSYPGQYVSRLFQKPRVKMPTKMSTGRFTGILLSWYHRYVYTRKRGFCYPSRIISALFVAVLIVYMLTFESLVVLPRTLDLCASLTKRAIEHVGTEPKPNEALVVTQRRKLLLVLWQFCVVFKVLSILSTLLATVLSLVNILHTLSSYRANMSALYRGDHSHIPPAAAGSNTRHCYNSIRFAGFQVGYAAWGYVVQCGALVLVSAVAAFLIALLVEGISAWFLNFLSWLWPYALSFGLMLLIQLLLSKFVFLQERGRYLALDNRGVYFNFTFFMFFYNTFIGLVSCLVRILKGLVVGIFLLGRLDFSPLPHRFEILDPGFKAYIGYMQMEAAHTHPVLIVFCRLLLLLLKEKREREGEEKASSVRSLDRLVLVGTSNSAPRASPFGDRSFSNPTTTDTTHTPDRDQAERCPRAGVRFRWHMAYTLLRNPDIQALRKETLRQTRLMPASCVSDCDPRQGDRVSLEQVEVRGEEIA